MMFTFVNLLFIMVWVLIRIYDFELYTDNIMEMKYVE